MMNMNKALFLSLFKSKKDKTSENNIEILLPELPFYGLGGTIYRIEEAPESYYKVLYNQDGSINPQKIPVPKKKNKNFNLILKDYCEDLKNYLDKFQNQYLEYENNIDNPVLTNKQFYALAIVTALATVSSIPFLLTTAWTGIIFGTISALSLYVVCDIHKKDLQKIKSHNKFKKQYKKYQRDLVDYCSGNPIYKEKQAETIYTEIKKVDKSYLKIFPKIRILKKDKINETA